MQSSLVYMQLFVFVFALFVAITTFNSKYSYPQSIENLWGRGEDKQGGAKMTWQVLNIVVIIAAAISLFETYQLYFQRGGNPPPDYG